MPGVDPVELDGPPAFGEGDRVRAVKSVRNDGTYPGLRIGAPLIAAGDIGYVREIGTFLQRHYIYSVDFYQRGRIVGMRTGELSLIASAPDGP